MTAAPPRGLHLLGGCPATVFYRTVWSLTTCWVVAAGLAAAYVALALAHAGAAIAVLGAAALLGRGARWLPRRPRDLVADAMGRAHADVWLLVTLVAMLGSATGWHALLGAAGTGLVALDGLAGLPLAIAVAARD